MQVKARTLAISVGFSRQTLRDISIVSTMIVGTAAACAVAPPPTAGEIVKPISGPARPPTDWGKDTCTELNAAVVGQLAYMEAKLELTSAQRPLWDKWRQIVIAGAKKEQTACLQDVAGGNGHPTILERSAHRAQVLSDEIENLRAAQPALEALYQALTAEQRAVLDQSSAKME